MAATTASPTPTSATCNIRLQGGNDDVTASGRDHAVAFGGPWQRPGQRGSRRRRGGMGPGLRPRDPRRYPESSLHLYGPGPGDDADHDADPRPMPRASSTEAPDATASTCPRPVGAASTASGAMVVTRSLPRPAAQPTAALAMTPSPRHGSVQGAGGNDRVDVSGNPDQSDAVSCGRRHRRRHRRPERQHRRGLRGRDHRPDRLAKPACVPSGVGRSVAKRGRPQRVPELWIASPPAAALGAPWRRGGDGRPPVPRSATPGCRAASPRPT